MKIHRLACIGTGGFAATYADAALTLKEEGLIDLVAVAEARPEANVKILQKMQAAGARIFTDWQEMLDAGLEMDVVTIGTGHHWHGPMTISALQQGCHVFLSKPATVTIQEADKMIAAQEASGCLVAVDYQTVGNFNTLKLKELICQGVLGRIRETVARCLWRRFSSYYERNPWAGKRKVGDTYVLDGPLNNPHAHYINNALYFASDKPATYATPLSVRAELYRSHPIENEDTACLSAELNTGVTLYHYSTLSHEWEHRVTIEVIGDKGSALWDGDGSLTIHRPKQAPEELTGRRGQCIDTLRTLLKAIDGKAEILCTLKDSRNHVLVTNGAYESCPHVVSVLEESVEHSVTEEGISSDISEIDSIIDQAADERKLFSELNLPWAIETKTFSLKNYRKFER